MCLQLYTDFVEVGQGVFGTVYRVRAKENNKLFAVKKVENLLTTPKNAENTDTATPIEARILQNTNHSNIIKYFGAFPQNQKFYIVMEFADKGTLSTHKMDWSEENIWEFLTQMTSALNYLHEERIIHRDIKPDNILCVSEGIESKKAVTFKLADFGTAKIFSKDSQSKLYTNTYVGTPGYMAPEVVFREDYTFSADMWSLGAVISFVCNNGEHLFKDKYDVMRWLGNEDPLPEHFTATLRNVVNMLLQPNYQERPSAAELYQTAKDQWSDVAELFLKL